MNLSNNEVLLDGVAPHFSKMLEPGELALHALKTGLIHRLHEGINSIGRSPSCDIVVTDDFVSRRHCEVEIQLNGACYLRDCGSFNGTWINRKRIEAPIELEVGHSFCLSEHKFVLIGQFVDTPIIVNAAPTRI